MTSLALQLKRLALPQSDPGLLTRKEVASLLFDPKDAAQMDRSSFYALGCTGLEELLGIEPAFYEFQDTLFSRSSLTLERSVQSREVNDKLDAGISLFLTRLCPYFLLKPAQKCIEWLVHRFHIQLYNVDSLLACALPYHETKMFVRVVQLLNINEATNRWNWLHCLQKPGVPLARGTLITHCYKDLSFMDFICTLVTKSIKAYSGHSANCSQLRVIFSFYASTIVPALDAVEKVSDTIISKLLPYIQKGLKSSLADYKAATYMIVCQLAVKVVLEASLVDTLALQLSKSLVREPVLAKEGLGCLIVLLQNQKEGAVGPRAFGRLCCMSSLVETLQVMASVHDVSPLLRYLLPHLVHGVFSTCTGERRDHTGLTQSLNHVCLFLLLDEYLSQSETSEQHITSLNQRLLPLVRLFESKYGGALDSVIAAHVGDVSDTEQKQLFHHFLSLSMSSGKYQILGNSDTSLLLSLKHPLPSVRSLAVEHLMGIITSGQVRHKTTFSVLIMSVLSHFCYKQVFIDRLDPEDTVSSLLSLLQRTDLSLADQWLPVLTAAVQLLSDPRVAKGGAELVQRAGWSLLPFLVITAGRPDSAQLQLARHVAQSAVIAQHPLTVDWAQGDEPSANRPRCVCVCVCVFFVPSGEVWWNPEKLDTNTCCYLALICRLFHVVVNGAGQGASAGSFRELMRLLLQVHLKEAPLLFRFLCVLWGYSSNQGEQLDVKVGAVLQTQALYVGRALLSGQPAATLADLASAKSPVFPSLLACLTSPVREVRRAGLGALQSLSAADASPFQPITEKLLKHTEEIIADPSYISQALGVLHEESVSAKGRSQQKKLQASMEQLLQIIQAPGCPSYTACTLLSALGQVNGEITKPFFSALPDEKVQQRLLAVMFDLLVESRNPLVANTVSSVFKAIAVDGELVANELTPPEKPKVTVTVQQTRRSKALQSGEAGPEEGAVSWDRVTLILELLQHKKKLRRAQLLVPPLFSLLARSLEPRVGDQGNMEYTKQLLLSCLLNVCQKLSPDGGAVAPDVLDEDKFNVELVVQCVRVSEMPQTHHHALLLLGAVAGIFPEKVLHNIMPIFTFMGANIMRLDDAYSFQVISKTVQTVIPALIEVSRLSSDTPIVHVFTDALPHVPEHRRLPILAQLVTTLGPARFLWVLMLLLFKQHATHTASSASEKDAALERDVDFWISLCCHFEVSDQLTSLIRILQYLMQLPQDKDDETTSKKEEEEEEKLIFSVEAHSSKELRHFKFLSVSFMAQLLASARFIGKVRPVHGEPRIKGLSQYLLEEILRYIHSVARCVEENADKPTAKFWRALLNKSYDALDKVNALLPTDTFITVMKGLMGNQLPSVRRKAMELLNNKLQHRTQWEEPQVTVLLQLSGNLLSIVGKGHGKVAEEEEEQAVNRQTALYSLKLLCRSFGSGHQEAFVPVLAAAVELVTSPDEEKNVVGSALLCIAEVVSTLKALAIPQLPRLMPAVLHALTHRKELLANEIYLLSAVTAMQRVTETLPHFISPYLQETTAQVGERAESSSSSSSSSSSQLAVRLASLRSTVATKLPPRVLLPTVTKCYSSMGELGPLMSILQEHIGHMEKEQLNAHQSELTAFFLTALDFRAQHCQGDLEKTERIEGFVIDCLLAMVMKLSEVSFRPLFFKLFEWSKTPAEDKERLLTFYRLADRIADRLKGLFVLFAGNLVKPFADLLRQTNAAATDEPLFDPDDDGGVEKSVLLLRFVLDCLHKIFLYDTQRFLSRERADALLGPLVDQLENSLGGDDVYQQRVSKHLLPCIAQFAVAMGDDTQWKALNYQILLKTRHASSKVRFSSLLMLTELAAKLRENYMVLLPETVPFLAELMEDECEEVEHQVQKVIQEMENILGEPLQSYF
uniref:HEAT repeat-containing protein 1 n=1 Tax=Myripristis murdjan TaxID=586833 RepID=A0A667YWZ9_9TELE